MTLFWGVIIYSTYVLQALSVLVLCIMLIGHNPIFQLWYQYFHLRLDRVHGFEILSLLLGTTKNPRTIVNLVWGFLTYVLISVGIRAEPLNYAVFIFYTFVHNAFNYALCKHRFLKIWSKQICVVLICLTKRSIETRMK